MISQTDKKNRDWKAMLSNHDTYCFIAILRSFHSVPHSIFRQSDLLFAHQCLPFSGLAPPLFADENIHLQCKIFTSVLPIFQLVFPDVFTMEFQYFHHHFLMSSLWISDIFTMDFQETSLLISEG